MTFQGPIRLLKAVADQASTPVYAYDVAVIAQRAAKLTQSFGKHFRISYAVKANPNVSLLQRLDGLVDTFDVSSFGEAERVLAAGCTSDRITFSGPAKREQEIERAVAARVGAIVIESVREADAVNRAAVAQGLKQKVLLRINPAATPRRFGVVMSGKASQFGVDEEDLDQAVEHVASLPNVNLDGFHIYAATNSLSAEAIAQNFAVSARLFRRGAAVSKARPKTLIFGAGFGIPYVEGDDELDIEDAARLINPIIDDLRSDPLCAGATCILELGRWIVGPAGWLLTRVVSEKRSRGVQFRMCDAGFNNHLAAFGLMGTVIRRNWAIANLSNLDGPVNNYTLVGPLCTTIDVLATDIPLPEVQVGHVLAIANSGAYGLSASPMRFISHPEPREFLLEDGGFLDVTEESTQPLWNRPGSPVFGITTPSP